MLAIRERIASLARFALGGVLSSAVVLGVSAGLHEGGFTGERVAAAVGLAASLVVNFNVMRHFVFRGAQEPLLRQWLQFLVSSGVLRGLEYVAFLIVLDVFQLQYLLALLLVLGASFVLKFVIYGRVFGAKTNANARSESNGA
jgi:putative flippase GtrA